VTAPTSTDGGAPAPADEKAAQLEAIHEAGYGIRFRFVQPHNAAFWVYLLIMLAGLVRMFQQLQPFTGMFGGVIVASVVGFGLYTVPFWLFINHVDRFEPASRKLCVLAFLWGGIAGTFGIAVVANDPMRSIYGKLFGQAWAFDWSAALTAPFVEELAKASGLILLITLAPRLVRTAFDGAVLGAFLGLGFTVFEDLVYVLNSSMSGFGTDAVGNASSTFVLRVLTGITSHTVYSAIFCMGLVWVIGRPAEPRRLGRGLLFIVLAMGLHGLWDAMGAISRGSASASLVSFVVLPLLLLLVLAVGLRYAARQERSWMRDLLQPEVTRGTLTADELAALAGHRHDRRAFVRSGKGHKSHVHAKHVLHAALDLAHAIGEAGGEETARVEFTRAEVTRLRDA
jgi:protease PrsW